VTIGGTIRRPGVVVLVGRAAAQAGFFMFTVGPAFTLTDRRYNELIVGITVMLLAVVAPVGAFQQHVVRTTGALESRRDAFAKSSLLASILAAAATAALVLIHGFGPVPVLLGLASVASTVPALGSSLYALSNRFRRSAALDAVSGLLFVAVTVPLVVADASVTAWAVAYLAVWGASAAVTLVAPAMVVTAGPNALGNFRQAVWSARTLVVIGVVAMAFNRADYLALTVVGSEEQATRYALASRVIGPIMIALGSLNNSLYPRQINAREDPRLVARMTASMSRRVGVLAGCAAPLVVGAVALVSAASDSIANRDLVLPTALLAVATIPFALALPYGFALTAFGLERRWLVILAVATAADLCAVLALGDRGAAVTASIWVVTQVGVLVAVRVATRFLDDHPPTEAGA
jgi:O-antigen/teichoic acid export membrane protein